MKNKNKFKNFLIILLVVCGIGGVIGTLTNVKDENNILDIFNDTKADSNYSNLTMACIGDSITKGARVNYSYPKLLENELDFERVYNYGYSGSTITSVNDGTSMIERSKKISYDLDIIMVMGGVNDYIKNMPLGTYDDKSDTTFYGALNNMITYLQYTYEDSFLFFTTPYQTRYKTGKNSVGYELIDYVNAIKSTCANYRIPVLDLYNNGELETDYKLYTFDDLHPNQLFYDKYTLPQITKFLNDNYKQA